MEVSDGRTDRLVWPTTRLTLAKPEGLDRDLILLHGIEPNMRWRAFSDELVAAFTDLGAELVILLGALLADSPHTRPVPVSAAVSDAELSARLHVDPVDGCRHDGGFRAHRRRCEPLARIVGAGRRRGRVRGSPEP